MSSLTSIVLFVFSLVLSTIVLKSYNYIRGVGNETAAEKCGIKIEGEENKWLTLILNASDPPEDLVN
jgi:hypothetical protein